MKTCQLSPIYNCLINGYSLIDNVFGTGFVVRDEIGDMFTTRHNIKLYAQAQAVLEDIAHYDSQGLAIELAGLREQADLLSQSEYERAVLREFIRADSDYDFSRLAGCME